MYLACLWLSKTSFLYKKVLSSGDKKNHTAQNSCAPKALLQKTVTVSTQNVQVLFLIRSHSCFTDSIHEGYGLKTCLYFHSSLQLHNKLFLNYPKMYIASSFLLKSCFRMSKMVHFTEGILDDLRKCWTLCKSYGIFTHITMVICLREYVLPPLPIYFHCMLKSSDRPIYRSISNKKLLKNSAKQQLMSLTYGRQFGKTVSKKIRAHTQIYNSIYLQSVLSFHYTLSVTDFQHIFLEYSLSFGNLKHPNTNIQKWTWYTCKT